MPADLEIGIYRWETNADPTQHQYVVDLRFDEAGGGEGRRRQSVPGRFPFGTLPSVTLDPEGYGTALFNALFADPPIRTAYAAAKAVSLVGDGPAVRLRVQLYVSPNTPELHALTWEALYDPDDRMWLGTDERVVFSRYALSADWRSVRKAPDTPDQIAALLTIANPDGLESYQPNGRPLARVDVTAEGAMARTALGVPGIRELSEKSAPAGRATLENLLAGVRAGCDLLYLVCHGAVREREPRVWLESADGKVDLVTGTELLARLRELPELPRLVVLASCQSAGTGDAARTDDLGALTALGPRLVEIGVPAVLAMQGNVFVATVAEFMPRFFAELKADGVVDRAMAVARAATRAAGRPDWWCPVLFHRLRNGHLWGDPGASPPPTDFPYWPGLLGAVGDGACTAFIGSGVIEHLVGTTRSAAARLAERHRFPLHPTDRDDLPQVAQYLQVLQEDVKFPRREAREYLWGVLRRRFPEALAEFPEHPPVEPAKVTLDDLIVRAGEWVQAKNPSEPHAVLARLPIRVYVTTNADSLLLTSLVKAGKKPHVDVFAPQKARNELLKELKARFPDITPALPNGGLAGAPDADTPLVYYLYGHWRKPDTVVLTEDDYFNFMLKFPGAEVVPADVRGALADSTLAFLGFRLEEWDFRVLVQSINAQEGSLGLMRHLQVAVQVSPSASRFANPAAARSFLENSIKFGGGKKVSVFWRETGSFLQELDTRHQERGNE